jgi:hypothetical protein
LACMIFGIGGFFIYLFFFAKDRPKPPVQHNSTSTE